ncbi:MAG: QacE family quaternary ammonium compound efflux SMR transporter [Melioribacteraceae bacterium]|nr:QacE family quaternary ammonium compound efflux SMR transporter [Melioribacteraceae bacterium]
MLNWIYLLIAGIMEIGWVVSLKMTEGFTKFIPLLFYAFFGFTSAFFLSKSIRTIPLGVAYSIWMGIGIIGTIIAENSIQNKTYNPATYFFILIIISGIIGLKLTTQTN